MWRSTVQEDNINNYGEVYLDLMGNVKVPQGEQKSPLQSYSPCKELPLATQNWQKDYVSPSLPEQGAGWEPGGSRN